MRYMRSRFGFGLGSCSRYRSPFAFDLLPKSQLVIVRLLRYMRSNGRFFTHLNISFLLLKRTINAFHLDMITLLFFMGDTYERTFGYH